MRSTPKLRQPRTRFALKAKPRVKRGSIKLRKGNLCDNPKAKGLSIRGISLGKIRENAAAGHKAGRRVKPKRETPRVIHSERSGGKHKRVRLHGAARDKRRAEVFERAGGRCEERTTYFSWIPGVGEALISDRCPRPATEWSHKKHAANKCDCFSSDCNIASCHECHVRRHNCGGKPITVTKKSLKESAA
jgi:hypothetical protein